MIQDSLLAHLPLAGIGVLWMGLALASEWVGAVVADGFGIKFVTWLVLGVMLGLQMFRDDVGMPAADFRKV